VASRGHEGRRGDGSRRELEARLGLQAVRRGFEARRVDEKARGAACRWLEARRELEAM
jgi:hypothetical protein